MNNLSVLRILGGVAVAVLSVANVQAQAVPHYAADLSWPRPLPNGWVMGAIGGLCVNDQDHVVIVNRQGVPEAELNGGTQAPPIIEFDQAGNVVRSWGDPNVIDNVPRLHDCHFDGDGNVWIASATSGVVQKFTPDGRELLFQIGQKGVFDSSDGTSRGTPLNSPAGKFMMPASVYVDRANGDIYVADGEGANSNRRIAVMNREGRFLRQWLPEGTESVHCMTVADDGMIYVCNRTGGSVLVYDKMGVSKGTITVPWTQPPPGPDGPVRLEGPAADLDFSPDQRLMFVLNQNNMRVEIIERLTGRHLGYFGTGGTAPGQFDQAHALTVDSAGNVFVADLRGRRVQKFSPRR
jgi:DNA-binding beta-propeller fold protein YncE